MVVEGEQVAAVCAKRVGLADEPQRPACVRSEDDSVFVWRGVEEVQDVGPRPFDEARHRLGGRVGRVRVTVDAFAEQLEVVAQLALGVEAAAGVVEVDVPELVEAAVLAGAEPVEHARFSVGGVGVLKQGLLGL